MRKIRLTQGKYALVDDDDFTLLNQWKWFAHLEHGKFYAWRNVRLPDGRRTCVKMHRVIMGAAKGQIVDHVYGRTLDNRKSKLRLCTQKVNVANRTRRNSNNTSGFMGVSRHGSKWVSEVWRSGKKFYVGVFPTRTEAAKARRDFIAEKGL